MAETRQEVKTFSVHYLCDECGNGDMQPTGLCLTSHPPQWPHKCTACGATKTFRRRYPYAEIEQTP